MNASLDRLNALESAWDALQPLTPENEARLWKKFRMLWNYHSNHIEGNTLTYSETELLLLHDRAIGNHGLPWVSRKKTFRPSALAHLPPPQKVK